MGFTFFNPLDPAPSRAKADHARFVQRIRRRYTPERDAFAQQAPGTPTEDTIGALIDHLLAGGRALPSALRVARQLVL